MILTIDQALNDQNISAVESALFDLNKAGVRDTNFLPSLEQFVTSKDSKINFEELSTIPTSTKFWYEQ